MYHQQQIKKTIKGELQLLIEALNNEDVNLFQSEFGQQLIKAQISQQENVFILYLEFVIKKYYEHSFPLLDNIFQLIRTSQPPQISINSIIHESQQYQIQLNQITHKCQCIEQIQYLLNKQMTELEKQKKQIQTRSSLIRKQYQELQFNQLIPNQYRSELFTCLINCIYCNLPIKTDIIQLDCQHCYHKQCFQSTITKKMQLEEKVVSLTCECGKKIRPAFLKNFDNKLEASVIQEKLFLTQLQQLRGNYISKYMACDNYQFCQFFYMKVDSQVQSEVTMVRKQVYYCPVCIGNFRFNTMQRKT